MNLISEALNAHRALREWIKAAPEPTIPMPGVDGDWLDTVEAGLAASVDAAVMTDFDVLAITTAYEQGVGKGHDAYRRGTVVDNPYAPGQCCKAWAIGYEEGAAQAARVLPDSQLRAMALEECRYTTEGNITDVMALGRKVEAYFKGSTKCGNF